jgi:ABC-2 type transport system permease protein
MWVVYRRELLSYFSTPLAGIFIVIFLALSGIFTFFLGDFFARGQADLHSFFMFHPWLYLIFTPAISMRLWAEERKTGTVEMLLTLPLSTSQAVLGKFLAALVFTGIALMLTFPLWITVSYLGEPDHGVILASYLASFLMAASYLAVGSFISAITKNQVIAFVVGISVCFIFTAIGTPMMTSFFSEWIPASLLNLVSQLSFLTHFHDITRGVIDVRDLIFFGGLSALFLFLTVVVVDLKKAE